jgi:hypothetical protein
MIFHPRTCYFRLSRRRKMAVHGAILLITQENNSHSSKISPNEEGWEVFGFVKKTAATGLKKCIYCINSPLSFIHSRFRCPNSVTHPRSQVQMRVYMKELSKCHCSYPYLVSSYFSLFWLTLSGTFKYNNFTN